MAAHTHTAQPSARYAPHLRNVRSMSVHELLDLVVYNPFFLTDAYYVEIGKAVRSRYAELKSEFQVYYSSRRN